MAARFFFPRENQEKRITRSFELSRGCLGDHGPGSGRFGGPLGAKKASWHYVSNEILVFSSKTKLEKTLNSVFFLLVWGSDLGPALVVKCLFLVLRFFRHRENQQKRNTEKNLRPRGDCVFWRMGNGSSVVHFFLRGLRDLENDKAKVYAVLGGGAAECAGPLGNLPWRGQGTKLALGEGDQEGDRRR